ncbi:MAG: hypothetical protein Q4G39_02890 [Brachymonas sp.]|nr:hypothetical protein [Brachymonas sp.]
MATTSAGQGASVGDYAMGDESAAIKKGRNRASAQVSQAELAQHRRQRTNASEELDLEAKKRRNKRDEMEGSMGTVNQGLGTVNNVIGTIRNLRFGF